MGGEAMKNGSKNGDRSQDLLQFLILTLLIRKRVQLLPGQWIYKTLNNPQWVVKHQIIYLQLRMWQLLLISLAG